MKQLRKKYSNLIQKTAILAVLGSIIVLFNVFKIPCIWLKLTGYPCPGCGITRACISALKLDFKSAFSYNPMFWSVPVLLVYLISEKGFFKNKIADYILLGMIGAGFLLNWIFVLIM